MAIRFGLALLLGLIVGSVATLLLARPRTQESLHVLESSHPARPDQLMPPVVTRRDSVDPQEHGLTYPPVRVRWNPKLDVTNEQYDCLNWPGDLKPDRRAVLARISKDRHELEIRIGYTLATIHSAAILTLRDDQTADAAVLLDSDRGHTDEDSTNGLTGNISINSLDWSDPRICGTFELHWTKDGSGSCQHGTFSIVQSEIQH